MSKLSEAIRIIKTFRSEEDDDRKYEALDLLEAVESELAPWSDWHEKAQAAAASQRELARENADLHERIKALEAGVCWLLRSARGAGDA